MINSGTAIGKAERLGFIGLGLMGSPMTRRLLAARHKVTVWNRSAGEAAPLLEGGATLASCSREVATNASIIFMCVTDAAAVEEVVFGADGFAGAPREGKVVVAFSS